MPTTTTLAALRHPDRLIPYVQARGLSSGAARALVPHAKTAADALHTAGVEDGEAAYGFFVPGRIEVLGKHTDYAGGRSLVCAVERGFVLLAAPHDAPLMEVHRAATGERITMPLSPSLEPRPGHWANYPMTVARRLARDFGPLRGARVAFSSNLPPASGMSSSSAFVVAFSLALSAVNDLAAQSVYQEAIPTQEAWAQYLGALENGYAFGPFAGDHGVGTFGGSEDHTAVLCSEPGTLKQFSYAPTRFEQAARLPEGYTFVVAFSGLNAEKAGAALEQYNRASLLAAEAAAAWRDATGRADPHLAAAIHSPDFSNNRMVEILQEADGRRYEPEALVERFRQFYAESEEILPAATQALQAGDVAAFGLHVAASQEGAERHLHNQVPETMFLVREARRLGAVAASAFGAGFGGAVWALARTAEADALAAAWEAAYRGAFPEPAEHALFFTERPGPAAFALA